MQADLQAQNALKVTAYLCFSIFQIKFLFQTDCSSFSKFSSTFACIYFQTIFQLGKLASSSTKEKNKQNHFLECLRGM